jgi:hypothetical protein
MLEHKDCTISNSQSVRVTTKPAVLYSLIFYSVCVKLLPLMFNWHLSYILSTYFSTEVLGADRHYTLHGT